MKYEEFKNRVIEHLEQYKQKYMPEVAKGNFRGSVTKHDYILPRIMLEKNLLPLSIGINSDDYHMYAHHLNSSQLMCINFFSPIQKEEKILLEIIKRQLKLKISPETRIVKSKFEHTPDGKKHTNFDFYLELTNGMKIYVEVKYTENGFGGITKDKKYPDRYEKEWNGFYEKQLKDSMYLKDMSDADFYKNYQINRNIAYVKSDKDFVCFVYPFENISLYKRLETINLKNVFKIDWCDICQTALQVTEGTIYYDHYILFKEKYLDYVRA